MSRRFTIVSVGLASTVAFLVGAIVAGGLGHRTLVVAGTVDEPRPAPIARLRPVTPAQPPLISPLVNFADVVERINPAVVNVDATSPGISELRRRRRPALPDPPGPPGL